MPKRIIEMVREKMAAMEGDDAAKEANGKLATAAIMDGRGLEKWEEYMSQFIEDVTTPLGQAQLKRLRGTDGTKDNEVLNRKRAYLLSNGVCGAASTGEGPGGGGEAAAGDEEAAADTAVAPSPAGLPLDFFVNTIDDGLGQGCLPE